MLADKLPEIRALPLFAGISDESFAALTRGAYLHSFPAQIELIRAGEAPDFLHVVTEGAVEMTASWEGRETVIEIVRPVSTFILAATLRDAPYLMSARAIERSRIVMIPSQDVRAVFESDAVFARAVVTELACCYRRVVKHAKNIKLRNGTERLANYLLREHDRHAGAGDAASFDLPIEKQRLAALLGMTPENLSRAFRGLKAYGVTTEGAKVAIGDLGALGRLARPTPLIDDLEH